MSGWFKRKDPVCGMKEETGRGTVVGKNWFCSENCQKQYEKGIKESEKHSSHQSGGCCH